MSYSTGAHGAYHQSAQAPQPPLPPQHPSLGNDYSYGNSSNIDDAINAHPIAHAQTFPMDAGHIHHHQQHQAPPPPPPVHHQHSYQGSYGQHLPPPNPPPPAPAPAPVPIPSRAQHTVGTFASHAGQSYAPPPYPPPAPAPAPAPHHQPHQSQYSSPPPPAAPQASAPYTHCPSAHPPPPHQYSGTQLSQAASVFVQHPPAQHHHQQQHYVPPPQQHQTAAASAQHSTGNANGRYSQPAGLYQVHAPAQQPPHFQYQTTHHQQQPYHQSPPPQAQVQAPPPQAPPPQHHRQQYAKFPAQQAPVYSTAPYAPYPMQAQAPQLTSAHPSHQQQVAAPFGRASQQSPPAPVPAPAPAPAPAQSQTHHQQTPSHPQKHGAPVDASQIPGVRPVMVTRQETTMHYPASYQQQQYEQSVSSPSQLSSSLTIVPISGPHPKSNNSAQSGVSSGSSASYSTAQQGLDSAGSLKNKRASFYDEIRDLPQGHPAAHYGKPRFDQTASAIGDIQPERLSPVLDLQEQPQQQQQQQWGQQGQQQQHMNHSQQHDQLQAQFQNLSLDPHQTPQQHRHYQQQHQQQEQMQSQFQNLRAEPQQHPPQNQQQPRVLHQHNTYSASFSQSSVLSSAIPAPAQFQSGSPEQNYVAPRQNPAMSNATLGPVAAVGINPADTFGSLSASSLNLSNASIEFSTGALAAAIPLWWNTPAASFQAYRHDIAVPQSNLSGNKYALLIGINYFNCRYSQSNNINSASAMKGFLMSRFGYPEDNITLLTDDPTVGSKAKSTRLNILRSIETMMEKIQANDSVFLYFSGFSHLPHSLAKTKSDVLSKIRSIRADYILPSDFEQKGAIESRSLYNRLVKKLPASARLIAVFDCRISDTALDVPYKYSVKGEPMYTNALSRNNLYETGANMCSASNASVGDLSHRFRDELIAQERQRQSSADGRAEDLDRIRQCTGDIVIFGWDYDYSHQENRKLPHVSGNLMSTSWSSAVDRKLRSSSRVTFQDILRYVKASSKDADKHLKPFVASGRKISIDDELVI